jgi:apolipoprotein D and lipocalin family protein
MNLATSLRSLLAGAFGKRREPPATVAHVDLDRLMGTWFEVARLPNLEADGPGQCSVDVTATYMKRPDGRITVQTASCNAKARMRRSEVNGTVTPADPSGSKLILRFFKLIRGDLWVIGLDPNYRWALMGTPSRRRLWLIAREQHIEPDDFDRAMAIAAAQGFDAARVQPTRQEVGACRPG